MKSPGESHPSAVRRAIPADAAERRWRAADGAAIRRFDWPLRGATAPRGSMLFLPGRGEFYEKYLETFAHWHARGWRVTALDWRGQGASGRLGADARTGHIDDFATWIGDLAGFWAHWAATAPHPQVLVGHSMGGHLALRAVAEQAATPRALVLSAPMLGLLSFGMPLALAHRVARFIAALGDPRRPGWKESEKPFSAERHRMRLLTHDPERYADEAWWRAARPELDGGTASWGWVEQAYASVRRLGAPGIMEQIATPVLMLATRSDALVSWAAIARAARRLPRAELVQFGRDARHELLREADPVRDACLAAIDRFLARAAPAE